MKPAVCVVRHGWDEAVRGRERTLKVKWALKKKEILLKLLKWVLKNPKKFCVFIRIVCRSYFRFELSCGFFEDCKLRLWRALLQKALANVAKQTEPDYRVVIFSDPFAFVFSYVGCFLFSYVGPFHKLFQGVSHSMWCWQTHASYTWSFRIYTKPVKCAVFSVLSSCDVESFCSYMCKYIHFEILELLWLLLTNKLCICVVQI